MIEKSEKDVRYREEFISVLPPNPDKVKAKIWELFEKPNS